MSATSSAARGRGRAYAVSAVNECCYELVVFDSMLIEALNSGPSVAAEATDTEVLRFAPARWLLVNPGQILLDDCRRWAGVGTATLVDVDGKWCKIELRDPAAARVLASSTCIETVLRARRSAALVLFDCPVIASRARGGWDLRVQSSFSVALERALNAVASSC